MHFFFQLFAQHFASILTPTRPFSFNIYNYNYITTNHLLQTDLQYYQLAYTDCLPHSLVALIVHAFFFAIQQQDWSKIPHYEQQGVALQRRSETVESPSGARGSLHPEDPYRTRVNPTNISSKVLKK